MSSWQTTPDQTIVNGIEAATPRSRWIITLAIDAIVVALLCWRPYVSQPCQMLVIHYYGFLLVSDIMALFLSERRRLWYYIFVIVGSAGLLQATIQLWILDLDGGQNTLSLLRILFLVARLINAVLFVWSFGPWFQHWIALMKYARRVYDLSGATERSYFRDLA